MLDCNDCMHGGVCAVRQKMLEQTMIEFPDGKAAIFNMESALLSCDHYSEVGAKSAESHSFAPESDDYGDDDLASQFVGSSLDGEMGSVGDMSAVHDMAEMAPPAPEVSAPPQPVQPQPMQHIPPAEPPGLPPDHYQLPDLSPAAGHVPAGHAPPGQMPQRAQRPGDLSPAPRRRKLSLTNMPKM